MQIDDTVLAVRGRANVFLSSVMIGLGLTTSAVVLGQSTAPSRSTRSAQAPDSGGQLEEVIVTAERIQSTAQRTPAEIEVVNAATFDRQHVVELTDLNTVLTDTQIVPIVGATQVTIRGIGSNFLDPRADPGVATSLNGLFFDRPLPLGSGFLDVARVEVLEGPQGTLYGRNSAAGALNIITNQPTQELGGMVQVSGGNLDANKFTGVLNLPVTNDLAVRFAYDRDRRNGYIGGYYDDINNDTGRISALWTPTDKLRIYFESDYTHIGGHGGFSEAYPCRNARPWSLYVPLGCPPAPIIATGIAPTLGRDGSFVAADQIRLDYDLGWATLTSISGFVGTHESFSNLPDGTYFTATDTTNSDDYSEEIRLAGNDNAAHRGGLAWQVGAYLFASTGNYYYRTDANTSVSPIAGLLSGTTTFSRIPQNSEAGYAQATYGLTDRLRLTGGVRFTDDYKGVTYSSFAYLPLAFTTPGPASTGDTHFSANKTTYKAGVEYDLAPSDHLLYATISTGYVAGGANGGNPNVPLRPSITPAVFEPETITAYEIGSKNQFLDHRFQLNGAFYYYDFHDYQYLYPSVLQGGGPDYGLEIQNVGSLTSYGAELNADFALTRDDRLSASMTWTHATFGAISINSYPPPFGPPTTITVPSGSQLQNAPEWTGLLGYEHTWRRDEGDSITFSANSKLSSRYLLVIGSRDPYDYQKSYTQTDASVAYHWRNDKWVLRVWGKNLENSAVNVYGQGATYHLYGIEAPRTYGATATMNF